MAAMEVAALASSEVPSDVEADAPFVNHASPLRKYGKIIFAFVLGVALVVAVASVGGQSTTTVAKTNAGGVGTSGASASSSLFGTAATAASSSPLGGGGIGGPSPFGEETKSHCHRRRAQKEPTRRRRQCRGTDWDTFYVTAPRGHEETNEKPLEENKASTARWIAEELSYGFLLTLSKRVDGTSLGVPFGNPYSYALVEGTPYFYLFMGDASAEDALTKDGNKLSTFSLSASSFGDVDDPKGHEVATEQCNIPAGGDPESPLCARLVFTGKFVNATSQERVPARDALFRRHPSMKYWPDHGWFIAKLVIQNIFFLDYYGWASVIKPEDYFKAEPNPGPYDGDDVKIASYSKKYADAHKREVIQYTIGTKNKLDKGARLELSAQIDHKFDLSICTLLPIAMKKPPFWCKPQIARWLVYSLSWGVLGTVSATTHNEGTQIGSPFGNIASFAEVGGTPYFYVMMADPIGENVFGDTPNSSASFTLTEAQLGNPQTGSSRLPFMCKINIIGDPENPPCARLVLSGNVLKVEEDEELSTAKAALFKKHPQFEDYPDGHGFFVAKLKITGIWMIAMYGWASIIEPEDYFKVM